VSPPGAEETATVVVCSASEPMLEEICERLIEDRYAPLPAASAGSAGTGARTRCRSTFALPLHQTFFVIV
jgi:hypothetical protein